MQVSPNTSAAEINDSLATIGKIPTKRRFLSQKSYSRKKFAKIQSALRTNLLRMEEETSAGGVEEWLRQFKKICPSIQQKFNNF